MISLPKLVTDYNREPCDETREILDRCTLDNIEFALDFDRSEDEPVLLITSAEEAELFDRALEGSSKFAKAVHSIQRGISVVPAHTSYGIDDATNDIALAAQMWIEHSEAEPAIKTGVRIVAIRTDVLMELMIKVYDLEPPCFFPTPKADRETWSMTRLSPNHRERDEYVDRMMLLYQRALKSDKRTLADTLMAEMNERCELFGEDQTFYLYQIRLNDGERLPSFDGFYGENDLFVDDGEWEYFRNAIEDDNTPPRWFPEALKDYLVQGKHSDADDASEALTIENDEGLSAVSPVMSLETSEGEEFNDDGNAKRFVRQHGPFVRYIVERSRWFVWDDRRWKPDMRLEVHLRAKLTARSIAIEAANAESDKEADALLKHAQKSKHAKAIKDMLTMAQSDLAFQESGFDRDKWLLNCRNGTIDLREGKLRPHKRGDYITRIIDLDFEPTAKCPNWLKFLDQIMQGNKELIGFLRRAVGYCLSGQVNERAVFVLFGNGANGKSVFSETLISLLGDYATIAPASVVMKKQNNSASNDLAKLRGARLVSVNETDEGGHLDESAIKAISGNDTLTARFLYGEFFDFKPEFKVMMRTNHKPSVRGTDEGIWDRLKLIPFAVRFNARDQDKGLIDTLKRELDGILAWAVCGCLEWQRMGLGIPEEINAATNEYRKEQDTFGLFTDQCCVLSPDAWEATSVLRKEYEHFCEELGDSPRLTSDTFVTRLKSLGCEPKSARKAGKVVRGWSGIGLLAPQ